jgi:hypothetical protein
LTVAVLGGVFTVAHAEGKKSITLTNEPWQSQPMKPATATEIDQLVARELAKDKITSAPLTTDEQFIRRATLDLIGQLPVPADVTEFVADKSTDKRAKLIDKLLATEEFGKHWASYWREVIGSKVADVRGKALQGPFEKWMTKQLNDNKPWDAITREMLTASGPCEFTDDGTHGAHYFLAKHVGTDASVEQTAETARIFLGIQIQCAQCHDHPFDGWKREQFHELAGYYARVAARPIRVDGNRLAGLELTTNPRAREHQMPSKDDPRQSITTHPRFLDGSAPKRDLSDTDRRKALADAITSKDNYWFAAAFVNRTWHDLMGQAFCQPVDDMGPGKTVVLEPVMSRLAASFCGSNYDIKALFRLVMNSQTYQRQTRLGESSDQHLKASASYPTRLTADALWESLNNVLGNINGPGGTPMRPMGPYAGRSGFEGLFKDEFSFDPSAKSDEIEGSIAQALLMMNSPQMQQKIKATGSNVLGRILTAYPQDDDAIRMVYLKVLARKPSDREMQKCRDYIKKVGDRAEAFEDLLWALINSTEFQTKR